MTALDGRPYGAIYLTPAHLADWQASEVVVRFDLSTLRGSPRDWIDLWLTPYGEHLQLPLEEWLPDLQGPPRNALHVKMEWLSGQSPFKAFVYRDWVEQELPNRTLAGYESVLEPSANRRDTFELRLSRTHVRFGMPDYDLWWIDADIAELGWVQGVVQFGHHSWDPSRYCADCGPNTWHWDNIYISHAVPFTMRKADRRYVDAATSPEVVFDAPAPADARLRFAGVGRSVEVSFDGGRTWEPAQRQQQMRSDPSRFQSYWTPIPAGVSRVDFRGAGVGDPARWMVRDMAIWSREVPTNASRVAQPAHQHAFPRIHR